jgi:hypothetical protein
MTCGAGLSERERGRARARARQAALLGPVAGPSASASAGARERAVLWAGPEGRKKSAWFGFVFVFLFQINE